MSSYSVANTRHTSTWRTAYPTANQVNMGRERDDSTEKAMLQELHCK